VTFSNKRHIKNAIIYMIFCSVEIQNENYIA